MKDHIEKLQKELDLINNLHIEFPDLEVDNDRWGRARYMSASANSRVDEVFFHRNCGCCPDSPLHARPYLKFNDEYVYSNPCNVMIGEPYIDGRGFKEYEGWENSYAEAGVNPIIIERIKDHIRILKYESDHECGEDV